MDDPSGDAGSSTGVMDQPLGAEPSPGGGDSGASNLGVQNPPPEPSGEGASGSDSGSQSGDGGDQPEYLIESASGPRGSQEYNDWFNELSYEDRIKVEEELADGRTPVKKDDQGDEGESGKQPDGSKKAPEGDGKNEPSANDVGEWTPEEFAKLDEPSQTRIKAMQEIISQFEPYMDGSLDKGLEIIQKDPVIVKRLEEIKQNGELSLPEEITKKFDAQSYIPEDLQKSFELLDDKGKTGFVISLQKAYEAGANAGVMKEQYNTQQQVLIQQRIGDFTKQLDTIVSSNPSLKAPVDEATGDPVPYNDARHPMNEYLKWAANELGDDWLATKGHKAGYAAYLAVTGKHDEVMANVVKNTRTQFIKSMEQADNQIARTAGRGAQSPGAQPTIVDGVDLNRYKNDMGYRRNTFDGASPEMRRRLEEFIYSGSMPSGPKT